MRDTPDCSRRYAPIRWRAVNAGPGQAEVEALAERALRRAEGEAQATAWWERRLLAGPAGDSVSETLAVEFTAIRGEQSGRAHTTRLDDDSLAATARGAAARAAGSHGAQSAGLPDAVPARVHDGWDPAVLRVPPAELLERAAAVLPDGVNARVAAGAARTAIASTRGIRAYEQRSFVRVEASARQAGRSVWATAAATGAAGIDLERLAAEVTLAAGPAGGAPPPPPPGPHPVVLGPEAVAALLGLLRPAFGVFLAYGDGPLAGRLGRRVASANVNLSESPRFARTLPRSFDTEGVPRSPVPLIQDGVAARQVHDTASAARAGGGATSTGHASAPATLRPLPEHLVLVGGGAAGAQELAAAVDDGLYIGALRADGTELHAVGVRRIRGGAIAESLADAAIDADPLEVLARTEALGRDQQLIAGGELSARLLSATVCPALRAAGGLRVL